MAHYDGLEMFSRSQCDLRIDSSYRVRQDYYMTYYMNEDVLADVAVILANALLMFSRSRQPHPAAEANPEPAMPPWRRWQRWRYELVETV